MKNVLKMLLVSIAISMFSTLVSAQSQFERPIKKVGDSATYQMIDDWKHTIIDKRTFLISAVSDQGYESTNTFEVSGAVEKIKVNPDLNFITNEGVRNGKPYSIQYTPDSGYYAFPLYVGKIWEVKSSFCASNNGRRVSYTLTAKVVGEEKLMLPAGEIMTLKITYSGTYTATNENGSSGSGRMKVIYWYAPTIGMTVKTQFEDTDWSGKTYNRNSSVLSAYKLAD